jgi:hypothetical protein
LEELLVFFAEISIVMCYISRAAVEEEMNWDRLGGR